MNRLYLYLYIYRFGDQEVPWSVICKLENKESWWGGRVVIQSKSKSLRTRSEDD